MSKQPYLRLTFPGQRSGERPGAAAMIAAIRNQLLAGGGGLEGCRLPPVRVLAHQLGVSKTTVESVYEELKAQGLVESRDRQGLFVAARGPARPSPRPEAVRVPPPALKTLAGYRPSARQRRGVIPLSEVFIDPELLPTERLAACFRSVLKTPGIPTFYDGQGLLPLREWIAARLRDRGVEASAEQIVITNGSQQALDIVIRTIATERVATESPAYFIGKYLLQLSGLRAAGLPVDPFAGVDLERWEALIRAHRPGLVYLTSNFQNPTGYSYSSAELARIIEWSREYGFGILEDDWGSEMLSYSEFRPCLRALGGDDVLYMNTFTKKLLPALRLGYLLGNERTVQTLVMGKRVSSLGVSAITEAGLHEFLDRGYYDAHLRAMQHELDARYQRCLTLLQQLMPPGVTWTTPGGGPLVWLELPRAVALPELAARLLRRGVVIETSEDAFFGEPHLHGFRVGYAYLPPERLQRGLELLAEELGR